MARRRTKREDMITPIPTPDKQLVHPSGWCMTNDHADCKYQFNHGKCGCSCHTNPKSVTIKAKAVVNDSPVPAPKRRGRLPKNNPVVQENNTIDDASDPRPWKRKVA